ncbi:superoxide dismutase [Sphingobacterium faecium]|uniref:superoxide dismutase n=1 Tax=Sphingobacterium faecium TaxID=34087 RepID=UPI003209F746
MSIKLEVLPYAYDALEPYFDNATMTIHHQRHHQTYVDNFNKAVSGTVLENKNMEEILQEISKHSPAIRNNGGGHYNHSLFWETLSPQPKANPEGKLLEAIKSTFGGVEQLKAEINKAGLSQFGSGWSWLAVNFNGRLMVIATANQDNPLMDTNLFSRGFPILGVDVWEHAYYLKYQNKRADYLDAFWSVLDWSVIEKKYEEALQKIS